MSFDISYIFRARDKFTPTSRKIIASQNSLKRATDNAGRGLIRQNSGLRKVAASLLIARRRMRAYRKETQKSNTASKAMIGKFKQIAALAIAGLGIAKIVQEGAKLEDALADLSAITGATGSDLNFLKSEVTALSIASRTLPAEVATAFKAVASAKSELLKDPKALSEVTRQVLLLKNAAGIEMTQAVEAVTLSLNQFGAEADQAGRFVNILAAGAKVGASEVFETVEAIRQGGVAANIAGLSFESFNALIQVMAKSGIKGARSGTELTALLIKMEAKMGALAPSVIGINESLEALEGMNLSAADSMQLFGLETVDVLKILTGNIPLIKQWTKEITGTDEASRQASIRLNTFNSMMQASRITLVNLAAGIFNSARPALVALGGTVNNFLAGLDPSDVAAFGLVLSGLGRIAQAVALVIGGAFRILMTVLKPVLALLTGIGEIIGQVAAAIANFDFSRFELGGIFDLAGKFLGLFGGDEEAAKAAIIDGGVAEVALTAALAGQGNLVSASPSIGVASPAIATANANATVNGKINVSASPGSQIDSLESSNAFNGAQGNVGLSIAQ